MWYNWGYAGDSKDHASNTNGGSQDNKYKVICFGEMLIDFVPTVGGVSLAEAPAFKKAPGGAPANVAVCISRLGGSSAFIGKAKIFHYGSISLISEPCKSAHLAAMKIAKSSGSILSYDPNLRLALWPSPEAARDGIMSIWEQADVIKMSEDEISFLTGGDDPNDDNIVLKKLFHPNLKLLVVTEGSEGCRYYTKEFKGRVAGVKVKPVDTTGAGDAFVGGILSSLATDVSLLKDEKRLREALLFANACGAATVTERGAIPALPTKEAVLKLIEKVST
ncbi:fructokinase, putative [Ricinus communis]|uniref:Fructokinase, putative n=1 Tax=Ricinus communis TaxID=3988 RepID=B9R9J4_RICCO|nr:fructokinase, putative [Ricinus communis]